MIRANNSSFWCRCALIAICGLLSARYACAAHSDGVSSVFTCQPCDTTQYCPGTAQDREVYACPTHSQSVARSDDIHDCQCDNGRHKTCLLSADSADLLHGTANCADKSTFSCEVGDAPFYYVGGNSIACPQSEETLQDDAKLVANVDSEDDCKCIAGYERIADSCQQCPRDEYKSTGGDHACTECPQHSGHEFEGRFSIGSCACNAGFSGIAREDTCAQCTPGKYKAEQTDSPCLDCEENHFCLAGSTTPTSCREHSQVSVGAGTSAESCLCNAGFAPALDATGTPDYTMPCVFCAHGKAKAEPSNEDCAQCSAGKYSDSAASRHYQVPANCASKYFKADVSITFDGIQYNFRRFDSGLGDGKSVSDCAAKCDETTNGEYKHCVAFFTNMQDQGSNCLLLRAESETAPKELPLDLFVSGICTEVSNADPKNNVHQALVGARECSDCAANSQSASDFTSCQCNVGYYGEHATQPVQCSECAAGTYADTVGTGTCTTCPAHSYVSETGSDDKTDCACNAGFVGVDIDSCAACPPGQFEENDACVTCPDGTYSLSASGSADECIQCGDNSQSSDDRSACLCNSGYKCRHSQISFYNPNRNEIAADDWTYKFTAPSATDVYSATVFFNPDNTAGGTVATFEQFVTIGYGDLASTTTCSRNNLQYACRVPDIIPADECPDMTDWVGQGMGDFGADDTEILCNVESYILPVHIEPGVCDGCNDRDLENVKFIRYFPYNEGGSLTGFAFFAVTQGIWNEQWNTAAQPPSFFGSNIVYTDEPMQSSDPDSPCANGDCVPCSVNTYKESIGFGQCNSCQLNAQSAEASTEEGDCKCNRGYIRDDTGTQVTCAACLPGKYSHDYQFDSNGDDTNDLDAIICEECGDYHHTETHHPATNPDECQECFGACGNNQFWETGCLIDGYVDNGNNRDFECGDCPVGLSGTDTASVDNDNNRGPGACVCLPGAYYNTIYFDMDDIDMSADANLARKCGVDNNENCVTYGYNHDWWQNQARQAWNGNYGSHDDDDTSDMEQLCDGNVGTSICLTSAHFLPYNPMLFVSLGNNTDIRPYVSVIRLQYTNSQASNLCLENDQKAISLHHGQQRIFGPTAPGYSLQSESGDTRAFNADNEHIVFDHCSLGVSADHPDLALVRKISAITGKLLSTVICESGTCTSDFYLGSAQQVEFVGFKFDKWPGHNMFIGEIAAFGPKWIAVGCKHCPAGKYKEAFATFVHGSDDEYMQCDDCPEFKSTGTPGADSISNCACQAGYAFDEDAGCVACAAGYFKNAVEDGTCTECDSVDINSGSWDAAGTTQVTAQSACTCDAGYELVGGVCTQCQPGKFKAAGGDGECAECTAGTYQSDAGQVQCEACQSNSQSEDGASVCTCNAGYQNAQDGVFSSTGHACMPCPSQTFKSESSVLQCQGCEQSCGIRDGIPHYITAACTTTSQLECSACEQCGAGQYAETECVHADNSALQDTVCVICPAGYYCPIANYFQADAQQCLNGATSPEGSLSEDDCGCVPGEYVDMENGINECTRCTGDVWCLDGQQRDCPVHSSIVLQDNAIDRRTDHSNIVSCMCHAGYYRDPNFIEPAQPSLDDTFECLLCTSDVDGSSVDNTYCQNNLQHTCQDPNEHTGNVVVENFNDPTDCKCIAGYYFNQDDEECQLCPKNMYCPYLDDQAYDCPNTRNTKNQLGMSSVEHCSCQAGYFNNNAMLGVDMLDTECSECSENFFCIGNDNLQHQCTAHSKAPKLSVSASACTCDAGFGCNRDTTCPGTLSNIFVGICVPCQSVTDIELTGGEFKTLAGNTECTACLSCSDNVQYASTQCTPTSDRRCEPCVPCESGFFELQSCQATQDIQCMICAEECKISEYEKQSCHGSLNRICEPIDKITLCDSGEYRKAPTEPATSDSFCTSCALPNANDYYGTTLHTFTQPGRVYDDETSCVFQCADNSILRDKFNISLGCVSCDSIVHDFMLKNVITRHETVTFHDTEVSLPTECVSTCKEGYEQHGENCRPMVGTPVMNDSFAVRSIARSTQTEGFVFELQFSNIRRHVVGVGATAATCSPRSPFPTSDSCCFSNIYRLTSSESMGAGPQIVDSVESTHPLIQFCARPATDIVGLQIDTVDTTNAQMLTLTVPDTALEHVSVCEYVGGTQHCALTFTYIDVLLRQQVSQSVEISTRHNAAASLLWRYQQYIPLSNFHFAALFIKEESPVFIYDCVIDVELSAAIIAQHDLRLSIDVYAVHADEPHPAVWNNLPSMQFSDDYSTSCERYAAQTAVATESRPHDRTIQLLHEHTSWRTRWHADTTKAIFAIHAVVTIKKVDAANELYVGVLHMTRKMVHQQPVCADIVRETVITTATAQVGVGFTPQMHQMPIAVDATSAQDQPTVRMIARGVPGQLLTVFIAGPPHTPCSIQNIQVFAQHLLTDLVPSSDEFTKNVDALTFTTYDVAGTAQRGTAVDFSTATRNWCRANNNSCYLEILSTNSKHVHVQDNCAHEAQNKAANRWLWTKFGYDPVQEYTSQACFRLNNEYKKSPSRLVLFAKLRAQAPPHFKISSDSGSVTTLIWLTARVQT